MTDILSVSGLMDCLRQALDQPALSALAVRGEISNLRRSSARHLNFDLKDEQAVVHCVMFAGAAVYLRFPPANGMQVQVHGGIDLYAARGRLNLQVRRMILDGAGALRLQFEQLRARLAEEGLFAPEKRRPLPVLPAVVGVVTSREGAVLKDILSTVKRRNPAVHVVVSPAPVQGAEAPERLVAALEKLVRFGVDVVIVARGGGSLEDLMAFNDEALVRAVAACPVPIVSAVGHETDVTLCDLAADRRASTPTAAAELVAPEREELQAWLTTCRQRLQRACLRQLATRRELLARLGGSPVLRYPERLLEREVERLSGLAGRLNRAVLGRLGLERERLERHRLAVTARHPRVLLQAERERLSRLQGGLARFHPGLRLERERQRLTLLRERLAHAAEQRRAREAERLALLARRLAGHHPAARAAAERARLGVLQQLLCERQLHLAAGWRARLAGLAGRLDALSPLRVLERGFSYTRDAQGRLLRSVEACASGDPVQVFLQDGSLCCRVETVLPGGNKLVLDSTAPASYSSP